MAADNALFVTCHIDTGAGVAHHGGMHLPQINCDVVEIQLRNGMKILIHKDWEGDATNHIAMELNDGEYTLVLMGGEMKHKYGLKWVPIAFREGP